MRTHFSTYVHIFLICVLLSMLVVIVLDEFKKAALSPDDERRVAVAPTPVPPPKPILIRDANFRHVNMITIESPILNVLYYEMYRRSFEGTKIRNNWHLRALVGPPIDDIYFLADENVLPGVT